MALRFPRGHAATKKMIASCAANGVGIEGLADAPRFRFTPRDMLPRSPFDSSPVAPPRDSFKGREEGGPSKRGSIACGKPKPKHIKNWTPRRLDANPQYHIRMAGDDNALTKARAAYSVGDPSLLREYLAREAGKRRTAAVMAAEPVQLALAA